MIKKFCSRLPRDISLPMYNEYNNRLKEINFILENREAYKPLIEYKKTIEMILALSIFYKRVIAHLNSATKFATTVFKMSSANAVRIGTYDLTNKEKERISAIVFNYNSLVQKYGLTIDILTTLETKDLLKKIKNLKWKFDHLIDDDENNINE